MADITEELDTIRTVRTQNPKKEITEIGKPKRTADINIPRPRMNTSKAQRLIFGIVIIITGLTMLGDFLSGRNRTLDVIPRRMISGSIAAVLLMLVAVPAPRLAVSFAGLLGIGALFVNPDGKTLIGNIAAIAGKAPVIPVVVSDPDSILTPSGPNVFPITNP